MYGLPRKDKKERSMKLIIERLDGVIYAYRETEEHFKVTEPNRSKEGNKIPAEALDYECNLNELLKDNDYIVQDLA